MNIVRTYETRGTFPALYRVTHTLYKEPAQPAMIEKTEFLLFQRVREIGPGWEVRKIRFRAHNFAFIFFTVGLILTYLI